MNELKNLHDAWARLDDIMVRHGMDKKAQPEQAQKWLKDKLAENALLRRQVDVLAERISRSVTPESFVGYQDDWQGLTHDEQIKEWADWSLEQAKKGMK